VTDAPDPAPAPEPAPVFFYMDWRVSARPEPRYADPTAAAALLAARHPGDPAAARAELLAGVPRDVSDALLDALGVERADPLHGWTVDDVYPGYAPSLLREFAEFCDRQNLWPQPEPAKGKVEDKPDAKPKGKPKKG
jgi:hypothetical protein